MSQLINDFLKDFNGYNYLNLETSFSKLNIVVLLSICQRTKGIVSFQWYKLNEKRNVCALIQMLSIFLTPYITCISLTYRRNNTNRS